MENRILASLVVKYDNEEVVLEMKDSKGNLHKEIDLVVLDYMLASYGNLERYIEVAYQNAWIHSKNVTIKIVGNDKKTYQLPFQTIYNDIIYKASECAIYRGNRNFILKGDGNQMVSTSEFHDFFNDFLANILDEYGNELINKNYFNDYPSFNNLIKDYCNLKYREDDIYAQSKANKMEKDLSSPMRPKTIEDYLRIYPIFRTAISYNIECSKKETKEDDNELPLNYETLDIDEQNKKLKGNKRSLCFLIGNNCEPLILKTLPSDELDDYIVDNYSDAKQIKRENKEIIESYILSHKEYVIKIRKLIDNSTYSGQLTILEHNSNGEFKRLSNGSYLRFPIIYTKTFKEVRNLYCNIDKFRREAVKMKKNLKSLENKIMDEKAKNVYNGLETNLKSVLTSLEEEKKATKVELENTVLELQKIVSDMQELEHKDYLESLNNPKYHRIFSEHISREVRYVKMNRIHKSYKIALDEWASSIENSPYRYDNIRFILRHLRKKESLKSYYEENDKLDFNIKELEKNNLEEEYEKDESILYPHELKEMYGDEFPNLEDLKRDNIHVQK